MTGEITLRGRVLPVGGLKEKLLAAIRGGVRKVLIPEENVKDLSEISDEIKNRLEIVPLRYAEDAIEHAFVEVPRPLTSEQIERQRAPHDTQNEKESVQDPQQDENQKQNPDEHERVKH